MSSEVQILFVDDEEAIRNASRQTLELAGFRVECLARATDALAHVSRAWPGIIVSDIRMPEMSGRELLQRVQDIDPDLPTILITGHGDISTAVEAMRAGAYDFVEKPYATERLVETVRRALEKRSLTLENRSLRSELESQSVPGPRIIGRTPAMQQLRATILRMADTGADILITGETGTGKELLARSLHELSRRREANFVAVNCGAVPESMIESELFGHEAGAFTGAKGRRIGKFEHANGGTLFLDEIESMPFNTQVHLLRVLQERMVERLGSNELVPLDLRVVAAAKADLRKAADRGEFRADLVYRLNVVTLEIPPLRERREDIPLLFQHFLLIANERYQREAPLPRAEQMRTLLAHDWPGNVRELRNLAERYVLLGEQCGWSIGVLLKGATTAQDSPTTLAQQVECFERSLIEQSLLANKGRINETMVELGIPRKTLYDKMRKYQLNKLDYKE